MATRMQVIKKLAEFDCTVEGIEGDYQLDDRYSDETYFDAWTKKGKTWAATGCHVVCVSAEMATNAAQYYDWIMEDLSMGVDDSCDLGADCDTCFPVAESD